MAVIQISKIQIRRGLASAEGLPQLASGEMGWALDQQRLFIGNGSVAEGAPAVGNTEVLTEARMFELLSDTRFTATNYTYMGHFTGTSITTGPDANSPVIRSLQNKLDDNVTVLDFGAEERTNSTRAVQRAIDELVSNIDSDLARSRVPVRIPAGEYYFTGTVYIPPYVTLVGDGIDKTVLTAINPNATTIFETWDAEDYGLNSGPVRHVNISGMTLKYSTLTNIASASPLMILNALEDSAVTNVKLEGNYVKGNANTTTYSAIHLTNPVSNNVKLNDLEVTGVCYPLISNEDIEYIEVNNGKFTYLYQGITLANDLSGAAGGLRGPKNVGIKNNLFSDIEKQAVYAGVNSEENNQINLESNTYRNVGNDLNNGGDSEPTGPIVSLLSHGNSSTNDNFERLWNAQRLYPDVAQKPAIEGTIKVTFNATDRQPIIESTLTQTLIRIPYANTVTSISIEYTLEKASVIRKGTISVVGSGSAASLRDTYNVAGLDDGETAFSAELVDTESLGNIDTLAVKYDNPESSGDGTIVFNVSYYK